MKSLFVVIFCLVASKSFSQTNDVMVEEKSSAWIKITAPQTAASKPKTTTIVKKKTTNKPVATKQEAQQEFEKTNSQVNRFKKSKKG
jgi:hypothetical protein